MRYTFSMMKDFDFDGLIIFVLGAFVAGVLFFGIITIVRKSFRPKPKTEAITPAFQTQQKTRAQSIRELEKEYRRKQQQKLRDYRR